MRRTRLPALMSLMSAVIAAGTVWGTSASADEPSSCSGAGVLFCENFDDLPVGSASSPNWVADTRNGTLTVEPGEQSNVLHVQTQDNGLAFLEVNNLAAPGNAFYGRMRLRVEAFPTAPDWAHFTLVEATGTGSTEVVRPVGGQYVPTVGRSLWGIGADGGPTGDWTNWRESAPVSDNTWQCVEWRLDPTDNRVQVWIDGVANPELVATTNEHGGNGVPFVLPAVNTVKIGWQLYQAGTTPSQFNLWVDDVVLSTERPGCA